MDRKIEAKDKLIADLEKLLKLTSNNSSLKRIQCIYFKVKYDKIPEEIGGMVGYNTNYVKQIQAQYWKNGDSAFYIKQKGGRRRENLTIEEEKAFIDELRQKANNDEIIDINKIKENYEKKFGKKVSKSTIYRMLKRHDWKI